MESTTQNRRLNRFWYVILVVFSALALILAILQIFHLAPFGFVLLGTIYFYCLLAFYLSLVFIIFPATKSSVNRLPWYDRVLFFVCLGTSLYFASIAYDIVYGGWDIIAPLLP